METFTKLVTLILILSSTAAYAYTPEEGRVSAYAGPMWYRSDFTSDKSGVIPSEQGTTGLVVIGDINQKSSLEIGMFFFNKQYQRDLQGRFLIEQTKLAHITMGYRRWIGEKFSVSFAISSGHTIGEPLVVHTDFLPTDNVDTSARDTTEYGLDVAMQFELWKKDEVALVFDARFAKSFTPKDDEKADHYAMMLAIQYTLQEKY